MSTPLSPYISVGLKKSGVSFSFSVLPLEVCYAIFSLESRISAKLCVCIVRDWPEGLIAAKCYTSRREGQDIVGVAFSRDKNARPVPYRAVPGRGEKSLLCGPGSELRLSVLHAYTWYSYDMSTIDSYFTPTYRGSEERRAERLPTT